MIVLSTKEEPTIKAEAFALGANDYLVKLPDRLELLARIRYHSKGYINLLQRNEAYQALQESQRRLAERGRRRPPGTSSRSCPRSSRKGPIRTDWRFVPSADLGGDSFGYHWLDDDHFAFYLLDVSGHGVGAALLSVSALNALRSQSLPQTDFRDPGQVLTALNQAFQMDQQNGMFFTIWYGVYHKPTRRLDYSGGGHPPAILLSRPLRRPGHARRSSSPRARWSAPSTDLEYTTTSLPARGLRQALPLQRRRLRDREARRDDVAVRRVPRVPRRRPVVGGVGHRAAHRSRALAERARRFRRRLLDDRVPFRAACIAPVGHRVPGDEGGHASHDRLSTHREASGVRYRRRLGKERTRL